MRTLLLASMLLVAAVPVAAQPQFAPAPVDATPGTALPFVAMAGAGDLYEIESSRSHTFAPDEIIKNSLAQLCFRELEVATYTALITMAEEGGFDEAIPLLQETLREEQQMQALRQGVAHDRAEVPYIARSRRDWSH